MKFIVSLLFILLICGISYSQIDSSLILGLSQKNNAVSVFDLSDPTGINMEVSLWGFIRYPGRYRVPINTTFMDLITYSGGPIEESNLEEIRIIRGANDPVKKPTVIKLNYDDMLWGDEVSTKPKMNPVLQPGDYVVVQREKRYTFRDYLQIYVPIITSVVSIATLLITISKN
ncbi:MAG: SLBB domain-containing protein [Ignavibacteria bacterium]